MITIQRIKEQKGYQKGHQFRHLFGYRFIWRIVIRLTQEEILGSRTTESCILLPYQKVNWSVSRDVDFYLAVQGEVKGV